MVSNEKYIEKTNGLKALIKNKLSPHIQRFMLSYKISILCERLQTGVLKNIFRTRVTLIPSRIEKMLSRERI